MPRIVIADVLYTATDETYYVLNREYENAVKYRAETLKAVFEKLEADGWSRCGKVNKADNSPVDAFTDFQNKCIAVWEE